MKTSFFQKRISRFVLVTAVMGGAGLFNSGCSPVAFTTGSTANCTVASPCATVSGLSTVTQSFDFNSTNKVDILIVDDNSGSMQTEQLNMSTPINGFINNLNNSGIDWQIGITSTDVCPQSDGICPAGDQGASGTLLGPSGASPAFGLPNYIIKQSDANAANTFANTMQRAETVNNWQGVSGDERAIYALNLAIDNANTNNAGLFRTGANLAVVILSDEDERSVGGDPAQKADPAYAALATYDFPQTFMNKVATTWSNKKVLVNSIIIKPGDTTLYPDPNKANAYYSCLNVQAHQGPAFTAHAGVVYNQLSQLANGTDSAGNVVGVGSICDNGNGAFASMLSNISSLISNLQNSNTITLAYIATSTALPSLTCTYAAGVTPAQDYCAKSNWTISGNQITFAVKPINGTTVTVSYSFDPSQQASYTDRNRNMVDPRALNISFPSTPDISDMVQEAIQRNVTLPMD